MVISIFVGLLFCCFPNKIFAQEPVEVPRNGRLVARKVIRDFVLYNYAHLADNIINGNGMYLATLYGLMGIAEEEKKSCQRRFLHVLLENKRIPNFSNCIAGYDQND